MCLPDVFAGCVCRMCLPDVFAGCVCRMCLPDVFCWVLDHPIGKCRLDRFDNNRGAAHHRAGLLRRPNHEHIQPHLHHAMRDVLRGMRAMRAARRRVRHAALAAPRGASLSGPPSSQARPLQTSIACGIAANRHAALISISAVPLPPPGRCRRLGPERPGTATATYRRRRRCAIAPSPSTSATTGARAGRPGCTRSLCCSTFPGRGGGGGVWRAPPVPPPPPPGIRPPFSSRC